jgi:hypothetical protein
MSFFPDTHTLFFQVLIAFANQLKHLLVNTNYQTSTVRFRIALGSPFP